jgi:hypothetical protein
MVLSNKTKFSLLAIAAITSLLMFNVFQVYAAPGQQKVATLVVFVNVINDDGGLMKASDFTVAVTAKDPSPAIFSGSETGTTVTMKNSEYKVTELAVKGYSVSYSPGCSGRINSNEAKTCVVTNDDIAAHLKVIKHVINDNGGTAISSDFTMFVCCNNPVPGSFQGSETGTDVKIGPGFYFVNENFNPDYTQSLSPECSGEINLGEIKTCTITNDDIPKAHLIVVKHVINNNGGTALSPDFTMFVCCNNPIPSSFQGSETGIDVIIGPGFYSVDENFNPQYVISFSPGCSGFINPGETRTCTITNDDVEPFNSISIANFNVPVGGTFNAPIKVTAPAGGNIGAADITLTYDPAIVNIINPAQDVTSTAFTIQLATTPAAGQTRILATNNFGVTGTSTLANVRFNAISSTAGASSPVTITVNLMTDNNSVPITPTITNGVASIT